jgi:hypothetical protein
MTVDPNATYSRASAPRGSNAIRFTIDLNSDINNGTPDLRRASGGSAGHVTDRTGLPRSLFSGDSRSTHHVFGSASGAAMEDEDVSFPLNHGLCTYNRAPGAKCEPFDWFAR